MMKHLSKCIFALGVAMFIAASPAHAADATCSTTRDGRTVCPPPDSTCVANRVGDIVCSTPGGGIELDRYRDPVCGPGYCTKDQHGDIFCSSAARGAASLDRYGNAACAVSCVPAKAQACVIPKPAQ